MIEHSDTQSFTNPQKKRIREFLKWLDESDKNSIVIEALEFCRDFGQNLFSNDGLFITSVPSPCTSTFGLVAIVLWVPLCANVL